MRGSSAARGTLRGLVFRLASLQSGAMLSFIALICGIVTGFLMVCFRLEIEGIQSLLMSTGVPGDFESLPVWSRLALPVFGAMVIAGIVCRLDKKTRPTGVVHVIERQRFHKGVLPIGNALWQFAGASLAIISGQSVGREGPSIHLGAACHGFIAGLLSLPRSSQRILVSCGVSAAIAASFNTPLAGVIFSMEVIMAEYSVSSFIPVILAAVSATGIMQWFFGAEPAFHIPQVHLHSLLELPAILILGGVIGLLAVLFIGLTKKTTQLGFRLPLFLRISLAGVIVGFIGIFLPETMGIGYDTINSTLTEGGAPGFFCALVMAKIIATALAIGLGIPAGLIGPTIVIGAATGMLYGLVGQLLWPGGMSDPAFYAVIGMGAMMAATLHAPLAALAAIIELTSNPHIIMPGMLAIVCAVMMTREGLHCPSVFQMLMQARGVSPDLSPLARYLQSIPVARLIEPANIAVDTPLDPGVCVTPLDPARHWVIVEDESGKPGVLSRTEYEGWLGDTLTERDGVRRSCPPGQPAETITIQADLQEASDLLALSGDSFLCVIHQTSKGWRYCGIVRRQAIEAYYLTRGQQ